MEEPGLKETCPRRLFVHFSSLSAFHQPQKLLPLPPIEPVESFLHKVGRWGVEKFKQYPTNGLFIGHYLH
jgi:hypothetical protein